MQHTLPTPTQSLQIDPHEPSLTPLSRPTKHYPKSFTQQLMEEDIDILPWGTNQLKENLPTVRWAVTGNPFLLTLHKNLSGLRERWMA